jgi:hypothetical protein
MKKQVDAMYNTHFFKLKIIFSHSQLLNGRLDQFLQRLHSLFSVNLGQLPGNIEQRSSPITLYWPIMNE